MGGSGGWLLLTESGFCKQNVDLLITESGLCEHRQDLADLLLALSADVRPEPCAGLAGKFCDLAKSVTHRRAASVCVRCDRNKESPSEVASFF